MWHILDPNGAPRQVLCGCKDAENKTRPGVLAPFMLKWGMFCDVCADKCTDEMMDGDHKELPQTMAPKPRKRDMAAVRKVLKKARDAGYYD